MQKAQLQHWQHKKVQVLEYRRSLLSVSSWFSNSNKCCIDCVWQLCCSTTADIVADFGLKHAIFLLLLSESAKYRHKWLPHPLVITTALSVVSRCRRLRLYFYPCVSFFSSFCLVLPKGQLVFQCIVVSVAVIVATSATTTSIDRILVSGPALQPQPANKWLY